MGLIAHPVAGKQKAIDICEAFIAGAPKTATGHVFYGVDQSNADAWHGAKGRGEPWYYIDNAYFDCVRGKQYRVTKNAIQLRRAGEQVSDGKRFAALHQEIKPWSVSTNGGSYLLIEQSPGFMRVVAQDPMWLDRTHHDLERNSRRPTVLRPWSPNKPKVQQTLQEALRGANMLITYSSAAAVMALLEGVPVLVSAASAVCNYQTDRR